MTQPEMRIDCASRFWPLVVKGPSCWEWMGKKKPTGYGIFHAGKASRHAHRVAYELAIGPVATGLELDHTCRNRGCVNPAHLEPVTHDENMRRSPLGNAWRGRTHCINGHAFTDANIYHYVTRGRWPSRGCRACKREWARAAKRRKVTA